MNVVLLPNAHDWANANWFIWIMHCVDATFVLNDRRMNDGMVVNDIVWHVNLLGMLFIVLTELICCCIVSVDGRWYLMLQQVGLQC